MTYQSSSMQTAEPCTNSQSYTGTPLRSQKNYERITQYYDIAGPDYESWSPNFNMHFGYCRKFTDIFFLERMLKNMNDEVLKELHIDPLQAAYIADLGCGVGAVARHTAKKFPLAGIMAITISDYQIEKGNSLNKKQGVGDSVSFVKTNFEELAFPDMTFTHAYALESSCYANGSGKELFIAEMARVLKEDGRFCIADGFIKHHNKLPRFFNYLHKKISSYWALPCFANILDFTDNLKKYGFRDIRIREITPRIVPSVSYVPWTCIKFFAKEIWKNRGLRMKKERWHNVYAPVLGMIMGLHRRHFGYYLVSGAKG